MLTLYSLLAILSTLNSWFRQNKWASFQRQLNQYDFKRMTAGTSVVLFLHSLRMPLFLHALAYETPGLQRWRRAFVRPRTTHCSISFPDEPLLHFAARSRYEHNSLAPRVMRSANAPAHVSFTHVCLAVHPDRNAYYHPYFVKSDRGLCKHIRRSRYKGKGPRKPGRPEDEPNFYLDRDRFDSVALPVAGRPPAPHPNKIVPRTPIRCSSSGDAPHPTPPLAWSMPTPLVPYSSYHPECGRSLKPPSLLSMLSGPRPWTHENEGEGSGKPPDAAAAHPPGSPQYYELLRAALAGNSGAETSVPVRAAGGHRNLTGRHGGHRRAPPHTSDIEAAGAQQDDYR
jgi:HSF-type DNA-binding